MDEAIPDIVGAAAVDALPLGLAPGRGGTYLVNPAHWSCLSLEPLGIFRNFRVDFSTVSAAPAHFKGCIQVRVTLLRRTPNPA
jgi:hypothetical protein